MTPAPVLHLPHDSTLPVSTLDDLSGQKVAVQLGMTNEELLVDASKRLEAAGKPLNTFQTGIAIRKDDEDVFKAIDAAFSNMKADGSYQAILVTWNFQTLAQP